MRERYHDPTLGRFTQRDPVYDPLDPKLWNRYVYVGDDPVNFVDPSGLSWWSEFTCSLGQLAQMIPDLFAGSRGNLGTASNFEAAVGAGLMAGAGWSFVVLESGVVVLLLVFAAGTALVLHAVTQAIKKCDQ